MGIQQYLTITALTKYIKRKFDVDHHLQDVYVKGEISNFKRHSSGHMYFTLKDEKSRLLAVMFHHHNSSLVFQPENGMNVLVRGEISVFEQSGQYQIYVKEMNTDGIGDLFVRFEQLKKKLSDEGLFSQQYKKPIPKFPRAIGIITSPTGAAIRDVLTTIERRYPLVKAIVIPALVQGPNAPDSICKAIEKANAREDLDVLIVGRGGGSIEELWAFNEEKVAKAIFQSDIPIISAVGHETDTTIADMVADIRAATPTGAAEMAVPSKEELLNRIQVLQKRNRMIMNKLFVQAQSKVLQLEKSYAFRYPKKLYEQKLEQLDKEVERLIKGSTRYFQQQNEQFETLKATLKRHHPLASVETAKQNVETLGKNLDKYFKSITTSKEKDLIHIVSRLSTLNPLSIMARGYSVVFKQNEELIKSKSQVSKGDTIEVVLKDGKLECEVMDIKESVIYE
ncbi:exodeoxyribonuclease VII large subunit [Peribacillus acanthi]|uniref:exodeoxyribonuclease VII large subunit n=1 Tax=Peribacillus acanthi TaxID=2171554 RepID=UPI000D3EA952|nr:exodeoxyribonuclease VII large subunit [Peribacillus acanthi]